MKKSSFRVLENFVWVVLLVKLITTESSVFANQDNCGSEKIKLIIARFYEDEQVLTVERHSEFLPVHPSDIGGPKMDDGFESYGIRLHPNEKYLGHFVEDNQVFLSVEIREGAFIKHRVFVYDPYGNLKEVKTAVDFFQHRLPAIDPNTQVESIYFKEGKVFRIVSILDHSVRSYRIQVFNRLGELIETRTPDSQFIRRSQEM